MNNNSKISDGIQEITQQVKRLKTNDFNGSSGGNGNNSAFVVIKKPQMQAINTSSSNQEVKVSF